MSTLPVVHIRIVHSGQHRVHTCDYCLQSFEEEESLRQHVAVSHIVQEVQPVFLCPLCQTCLLCHIDLLHHLQARHQVKVAVREEGRLCEYCGLTFPSEATLLAHITQNHGQVHVHTPPELSLGDLGIMGMGCSDTKIILQVMEVTLATHTDGNTYTLTSQANDSSIFERQDLERVRNNYAIENDKARFFKSTERSEGAPCTDNLDFNVQNTLDRFHASRNVSKCVGPVSPETLMRAGIDTSTMRDIEITVAETFTNRYHQKLKHGAQAHKLPNTGSKPHSEVNHVRTNLCRVKESIMKTKPITQTKPTNTRLLPRNQLSYVEEAPEREEETAVEIIVCCEGEDSVGEAILTVESVEETASSKKIAPRPSSGGVLKERMTSSVRRNGIKNGACESVESVVKRIGVENDVMKNMEVGNVMVESILTCRNGDVEGLETKNSILDSEPRERETKMNIDTDIVVEKSLPVECATTGRVFSYQSEIKLMNLEECNGGEGVRLERVNRSQCRSKSADQVQQNFRIGSGSLTSKNMEVLRSKLDLDESLSHEGKSKYQRQSDERSSDEFEDKEQTHQSIAMDMINKSMHKTATSEDGSSDGPDMEGIIVINLSEVDTTADVIFAPDISCGSPQSPHSTRMDQVRNAPSDTPASRAKRSRRTCRLCWTTFATLKRFQCGECDKSFVYQSLLLHHMKKHIPQPHSQLGEENSVYVVMEEKTLSG